MGYTLRVMRIDFDRLMSIPGSRDARLLARLRPALEEVWDSDDIDEDEEPPLAMPPEALEQILAGEVPQEDWGGEPYYEAVAAIYDDLGTELDELHLASCEMSHLQEVENALKDVGAVAPLSFLSLAHGGVPFRVPRVNPSLVWATSRPPMSSRREDSTTTSHSSASPLASGARSRTSRRG